MSITEPDRANTAVHPCFMGGEYLPDRCDEEIEIARITIASTTKDVTCIYASRAGNDISYRAVDEYEGDTLTETRTHSSRLPLTVSELADFFLQAWDLFMILDMNFESDGRRANEVRAFFWGSSEFYPGFKLLLAHRVEEWLEPRTSRPVIASGAAEAEQSGGRLGCLRPVWSLSD